MKCAKLMLRHRGEAKTWILIVLILLLALAVPAGLYYISTISFSNGTTGANLSAPNTGQAPTPAPAPTQTPAAVNATPARARAQAAPATPAGGAISGSRMMLLVVDEQTKQPLAEMHVQCNGAAVRRFNSTTDANGRCAVPMPPDPKNPSNYVVRVSGKGYVPKRLAWQPWDRELSGGEVPASYTMTMEHGVTIGGKIVDDAGQPVADAHVYVSFDQKYGNGHEMVDLSPWDNNKQPRSSADGSWTYSGAPANCNQVGLTAWDYHHVSNDFFNPEPYGDAAKLYNKTAVYVLQRGLALDGKVVDGQGAPIAGATVTRGQGGNAVNNIPPQKTDANGHFSYQYSAGQQVTLTAQAHGYAPQAKQLVMGSANQSLTFQLGKGHRISGKVVDASGRPVANAHIMVQSWGNDIRGLNQQFNADRQGNFHWDDAPADPVTVSVYAPGVRQLNNQTLTPDTNNIITLGTSSRIRGTVTEAATGNPIENFKVTIGVKWPNNDEVNWQQGWNGNDWGIRGNSFDFENQWDAPGIAVRITASGYLPTDSRIIRADERNVVLDLKMKPGKDLTFTVLTADGAPVADAQAVIASPGQQAQINDGQVMNFGGPNAASDRSGKIDFPPLTGAFKIAVVAPEGFAEFDQNDLSKSDQIHLAQWGVIKGRMMIGSKPAAQQWVDMSSMDRNSGPYDPQQPRLFIQNNVQTDADGNFEVDRIAPGKWSLGRRVPMGNNGWSTASLATEDVQPGQTITVKLGGTGRPVIGKVALPASLAGRSDWRYSWSQISTRNPVISTPPPMPPDVQTGSPQDQQRWFRNWVKTDDGKKYMAAAQKLQRTMRQYPITVSDDGSFRADDVPPGDYTVNINLQGQTPQGGFIGQMGMGSADFTMPQGGSIDDPLNIGAVSVTTMEKYKVGDAVYDLPLRMTDGKLSKLSDFKGKYVLIDILNRAEMPLSPFAAVDADYGKDSRLTMLTILPAFRYASAPVKTDKNPGLHASVVPGNGSLMILNRSFDGSAWLIGPDQKVVAEDLSGDGIHAAVGAALGAPQPVVAETATTQPGPPGTQPSTAP